MWDVIVLIPDHCLSIYTQCLLETYEHSHNKHTLLVIILAIDIKTEYHNDKFYNLMLYWD